MAQMVKNPPAIQETRVQSLGWQDPLEKEIATHSSILAWKIPWTEETARLQSMGSQRVAQRISALQMYTHLKIEGKNDIRRLSVGNQGP